MSRDFTTTGLLRQTKRRGFLSNGAGLTNGSMLEAISEQLRTAIPAFLKDLREEYIIAKLSIPVTSATVPAPARAVGAALRTVKWVSNDGTEVQLPRIEPERRQDYALTDSCPQVYYFEGNNLILVPAVSSGTVVLAYQQRPGELVLPSECGKVLSKNANNFTVTVEARPSGWTADSVYDFVSARNADNFKAYALDVNGPDFDGDFLFTGNVGTFSDLPSWFDSINVGDYICLAEETCIPQLPMEVHDLLAQQSAWQLASDTGSTRLPAIEKALTALKEQLTTLLSPRSDGSPRVIVNRSRIGRYGGW